MTEAEKSKIIELLRDDEHYYGDVGKQFLSNSNIKTLFENPELLGQDVEKTPAMVIGGYMHTIILEPNKIDGFKIIEASTRNTNKYKEISDGEVCLLEHEADMCHAMRDRVLANDVCRDLIRGSHKDSNIEYEVPQIMEFFGNWWKCKADILNHDEKLIIDLKSTGDISRFKYSADRYNYDSQAYIYSKMFGYEFLFIAIEKKTNKIAIFNCSDDFLYRGEQKLVEANQIYDLFHKTEDFDPNQYIETLTL